MKTIVQFIDKLDAGGKERQCVDLVNLLSQGGATRSVVVTMSPEIFFTGLAKMPNVHVELLLRRTRRDPWIFLRFLALCRRWRADLVTAWHPMTTIYAIPATRLLGIPLVTAMIQDAPAAPTPQLLRRTRIGFACSAAVVGNSLAGIGIYAPPAHKTHLIRTGYDLTRAAARREPQAVRAELGLNGVHVVGMVATFSSFKDQPTLIAAALRLLAERRDVVFLLVGIGPSLEACRALVPDELRHWIRFTGAWPGAIEDLVQLFDIGVLATFTEGISNSIVEYMVLEKPVVATDGGGTPELVTDGETGLLVPQRDPARLAAAIARLLDNPALRLSMGRRGRRYVEDQLSVERTLQRFDALYGSLLARRRPANTAS